MRFPKLLASIALLLLLQAAPASAQSFFDAGGGGDEEAEAEEGLESATPTDSVNELGSGNGAGNSLGNSGGDGNFPAANQGAENFQINDSSDGSDDLFGDEGGNETAPVDEAPPSAFGNGTPTAPVPGEGIAPASAPANAPANLAPAANAPVNSLQPQLTNPAPANPAAAPAGNAPANAQSLMNQISTEPAAAPVNPAAAPAASAPAEPTSNAAGLQATTPPPPAEPVIEAPALPEPNEFAGAPPVPGTARLMAEGEAPEEYMVQGGDTLFDICDQLLDEPGYWPKLWALNPEIKNPHFIYPNMRLRFYPGDDETPPYLQVVTEDDVIPIDKGDLDEQQLVAEKVIFPENEEGIAEDQIVEVIGPDQVDALEGEILLGGRDYHGSDMIVQVPGFLYAEEKAPLAVVVGQREGNITSGPDRRALIEAVDDLTVGTLYTILRPASPAEDPETGDIVGFRYYFVANARVQRAVEDGIHIATIEGTRLPVMPNDIVVSYISTIRTMPGDLAVGPLSNADATVVAFEYPTQEIGGSGNFVFIDKGSGEGVSAGMFLPIYATPGYLSMTSGEKELPVDYETVAAVRIIDTTDAGSVGYVLRNTREIRIGDRTGKD